MSELSQYLGKKVYCEELNTKRRARFRLTKKGTLTEFFDFESPIFLNADGPIFLCSEHADIISLHKNHQAGHGTRSKNIAHSTRDVFHQNIRSHTSIIGPDLWTSEDIVRRASFVVNGADHILQNQNLFGKISDNGVGNLGDTTIFNVQDLKFSLSAWYGISKYHSGANREIRTHCQIEFNHGISLKKYLEYILRFTAFLSFSAGSYLSPSSIRICKLSTSEMIEAVDQQTYQGDYAANHWLRHVKKDNANNLTVGNLFLNWDEPEKEILCNALIVWMNRIHNWKKADALMMEAFVAQGTISADRLINACKWFEEIPLTSSKQAISEEHIEEIISSVTPTADRLGYSYLTERIRGALSHIKSETRRDLFKRILSELAQKLGKNVLDANILEQLLNTVNMRGQAAHRAFYATNEASANKISESICAMEAFCFLLTACELPMKGDNICRLDSQPMVAQHTW